MPLVIVVNREGGTAASLGPALDERLRQSFKPTGRPIRIRAVAGADVAAAVAESPGERVVVGGGDGTLASAAAVLAEQDRTLAVLPLGTRNHFARQIGLTGDLDQAARIAAGTAEQRVDVGTLGNRVFLNNASLGLYTRLVRERQRHALPRWLATIPATLYALRHLRTRHYQLDIDGAERQVRTPLLFIGNNRYRLEGGEIGPRVSLREGRLAVYAVAAQTSWQLIGTALRLLFGRTDHAREFAELSEAGEVVMYGHHAADVALDGELVRMHCPLRFAIRPGALKVASRG